MRESPGKRSQRMRDKNEIIENFFFKKSDVKFFPPISKEIC